MEEKKTYLINIESNLKQYADDAAKAKKTADDLKVSLDELKKSNAKPEEIEAATAAHKNANDEYRKAAGLLKTAIANNQSEAGSRKQLSEQLKLQEQALGKLGNAYIKDAQGVMRLNPAYAEQRKQIAATKQQIIDYDLALNDGRTNIGRYGEAVSAAFKDAGKSILSMVSPMALVAAGIALATKILGGLKDALMSTTKAMDQMTIYGQIAKQMLYDLATSGRVSTEAMEKAAIAADLMNQKRKGDRQDMVEFALLEREIAKAEFDSADKTKTLLERQTALNLAIAKQNELSDKKIIDAKEDLRIDQLLINNQPKNEKFREKYAKDLVRIIDLDKERFEQNKRNEAKVTQMQVDETKRIGDQRDALMKLADEQIEINKEDVKKALKAKEDANKAMLDAKEKLNKEISDYKQFIIDQQKLDKEALDKKKKDKLDHDEWVRNRDLSNEENIIAIREANQDWLYNTERARLEIRRKDEVANAEKTGADINLINAKYSALNRQIDIAEKDAKLMLYSDFAGNLATIFGEQTAIGKAAAIAQTTISTYVAAQKAYASVVEIPVVGPVLAVVAAAAAIAAGIANVKKIMEVKVPGGGGGGGSLPTSISSSVPAQKTYASQVSPSFLMQTQLSQSQLNALPNQNMLTAADIAKEISKIPAPVVTVEDINAKTKSVNKVSVRANI